MEGGPGGPGRAVRLEKKLDLREAADISGKNSRQAGGRFNGPEPCGPRITVVLRLALPAAGVTAALQACDVKAGPTLD